MRTQLNGRGRFGVASVIAMLFLAIISALAVAMIGLTRTNTQIAMNQTNVERARLNAEMGMRFIAWKFASVQLPQSQTGVIDSNTAKTLWGTALSTGNSTVLQCLYSDANYGLKNISSTVMKTLELTNDLNSHPQLHIRMVTGSPCPTDFEILATPAPALPTWATSGTSYSGSYQVIGVQSMGRSNGVSRIIKAYFLLQKSFRYGVLSRLPVQLGKNTVVEGDIYYAKGVKDATGKNDTQPPLLSISDFRYTSGSASGDTLTTNITNFETFLHNHSSDQTVANRIPMTNTSLVNQVAAVSGLNNVTDLNSDGYIDEYDIFLDYFHRSQIGQVKKSEYLAAAPNDPNLFYLIDRSIGGPVPGTPDTRTGYADDTCDSLDPYAKVKGQVRIWETKDTLSSYYTTWNKGQTIENQMQGSIVSPDGYTPPVLYGQQDTTDPATQITAASFTQSAYLLLSGTNAGSAVTPTNPISGKSVAEPAGSAAIAGTTDTWSTSVANWPLSQREYANTTVDCWAIANGTTDPAVIADVKNTDGTSKVTTNTTGVTVYQRNSDGSIVTDLKGKKLTTTVYPVTQVVESIPYGASSPRGTVTRPVVSGYDFRNCVIKRGGNALFVNCRFDGVTFVDGDKSMAASGKADDKAGNNFRFVGCTFTGPLVQGDASNSGATPANYGDCSNSWEFMGNTTIDLRQPGDGGLGSWDGAADSTSLTTLKQQATIQAPQTNIEMGSFTNPGANQCSFQGLVVAGCFDCRGVADIDGSIVVLNPGATNCTLGYFGADDGAGNQGQPDPNMVGASYGRIRIRFNPLRTLPDGFNLNVSVYPDITSMEEVTQWQAQ